MRKNDGCLPEIVCAIFGFIVGLSVGAAYEQNGHEQGVRDALAGRYVIVELPDGTSVVVQNKEGAKP